MHDLTICNKCGEEIHSNLKFCPFCGKKRIKRQSNKAIIIAISIFSLFTFYLLFMTIENNNLSPLLLVCGFVELIILSYAIYFLNKNYKDFSLEDMCLFFRHKKLLSIFIMILLFSSVIIFTIFNMFGIVIPSSLLFIIMFNVLVLGGKK